MCLHPGLRFFVYSFTRYVQLTERINTVIISLSARDCNTSNCVDFKEGAL